MFSVAPVQTVQFVLMTEAESSRDAVEPAGGRISKKSILKNAPDCPDKLIVMPWVVPAFPVKLYHASTLYPAGLKIWQFGHLIQVPPPPVTDAIVTLLGVEVPITQTLPGCVGAICAAPMVQLLIDPI